MSKSRTIKVALIFLILLMALGSVSIGTAEARMGGSFGSRGSRTFQAPTPTKTAPYTAPVTRSMTPNTTQSIPPSQSFPGQARPGFWNGFGGGFVGGLVGGLLFNGLFGMMLGHGFGGIGGGFSFIFQLLLIGGLIMLAMRFFSRDNAAPANMRSSGFPFGQQGWGGSQPSYPSRTTGLGAAGASGADEIGITDADRDAFERILGDVQAAFSREDHQGLRRLTTPEMVSYLSEELADNATHGLKNDVTNLELLEADIAEAWREGSRDYATAAMRWQAIDVMRNRQTGAVEKGDPKNPVEATELWTFTREAGGPWLLSAIQDASN
ncbi:TIM44-like domain-containing protein [Mesorhizobium sp. WSM4884]|uniref:Tim44 domain-containing protein n=1 Tax=Mesorhizobium sp. WSM4884 TaxID=3038542 RepID=UPI0024178659|nr:TIM44-like domain-containing protein [Mesorhizobium sp. WSM4884]MDG4881336.1 TIM44-like domain-containing protein [Mesorhizobium sp. WSM4884]